MLFVSHELKKKFPTIQNTFLPKILLGSQAYCLGSQVSAILWIAIKGRDFLIRTSKYNMELYEDKIVWVHSSKCILSTQCYIYRMTPFAYFIEVTTRDIRMKL